MTAEYFNDRSNDRDSRIIHFWSIWANDTLDGITFDYYIQLRTIIHSKIRNPNPSHQS